MNVSLTPELEDYVRQKVDSGMYQSASEVIREGLRMLREHEDGKQRKLEELRREIQIGIDQADRGELAPLDAKATLARLRAKRRQQGRR